MSFLKRFFMNVLREQEASPRNSSFQDVSEEELEAHLRIAKYGDFRLTDAIRPSFNLEVTPQQGYRHDEYRDETDNTRVPVLMAAASREILFELFLESLEPLGQEVDVVLETSHHRQSQQGDLYREHIDMPVLRSILWDYEDLLVNDGCTGIAVINPEAPQEVQLDEHKLLIIYGAPLDAFKGVLNDRDVQHHEELRFITEAEHVHSSKDEYWDTFLELKTRLGIDDDMYS